MSPQGKFDCHVFVCLNERPGSPSASCHGRGASAVHTALKDLLKQRGLSDRMRANRAGCLDVCDHGPALVVYPDNVWYGSVTPEDVPLIVDRHLLGGEPVAHLRISDETLRG